METNQKKNNLWHLKIIWNSCVINFITQSHACLFTHCLCLLPHHNGRGEYTWQRPSGPQSWKYLLCGHPCSGLLLLTTWFKTSRIRITWEMVRKAESWALSQNLNQTLCFSKVTHLHIKGWAVMVWKEGHVREPWRKTVDSGPDSLALTFPVCVSWV